MGDRLHGVLLALSGDDAELLRAVDAHGSGLRVVRRCADPTELLAAAMAGAAPLVVVDTAFEDFDRSLLERLRRAGTTGVVLAPEDRVAAWTATGWPVEARTTDPAAIRARLQVLARRLDAATSQPATPRSPEESLPGSAGAVGSPAAAVVGEDPWVEFDTVAAMRTVAEPSPGAAGGPGVASPPLPPAPGDGGGAGVVGVPASSGSPGAPVATGNRRQGGLLVVWGPHGSPGRTTVAASLAHGLAQAGGAILVDADLEAPCLTQVLGLPENSSGLATAARLAGHGRLDAESLEPLLVPVGRDLWLLSGLGRPGRWRELPPASMTEVWNRCRRRAAWTVVDVTGGPIDDSVDEYTLEPGRGALAADLVRSADVVVVVGGADPVGVHRLLQLLGDLDGDLSPSGRMEVVVSRVRPGVAGPSPRRAVREALERYGGLQEVTLLPDDPVTADRCLMEGRAVTEAAPGSSLGLALGELTERIDLRAHVSRRALRAARRHESKRRRKEGRGAGRGVGRGVGQSAARGAGRDEGRGRGRGGAPVPPAAGGSVASPAPPPPPMPSGRPGAAGPAAPASPVAPTSPTGPVSPTAPASPAAAVGPSVREVPWGAALPPSVPVVREAPGQAAPATRQSRRRDGGARRRPGGAH